MKNVTELIRARRSVRTFDGRMLDAETQQRLMALAQEIENPYGIPVAFRYLNAVEHGLSVPVVSGCDLYIGGKITTLPHASVAFGYSFERFVLLAKSLGLGTVWLGGTMNRAAFEAAMELGEDEIMPCASPVGYTAEKMSLRESMMRKAVKADARLPFESLFYRGDFSTPLTASDAGALALPLEMVRLAPSAVNKQPWRVIVKGDSVHFYLKRSKGFGHEGKLDMQMIDMGIALCHFDLTAQERGLDPKFWSEDPNIPNAEGEYIASYVLK